MSGSDKQIAGLPPASRAEMASVVTEFFVERVQGCGLGKYRQQEQAKAPKIERDNSPGMSSQPSCLD